MLGRRVREAEVVVAVLLTGLVALTTHPAHASVYKQVGGSCSSDLSEMTEVTCSILYSL